MSSPTAAPSGLRTLLGLAWPVVLARSTQSVIGFADAIMVADLGEAALAATTTGALNTFSLAILPMGTVFIVQSFAAQLHGKGDLDGARRYAWYGLLLAGLLAVVGAAAIPLTGAALGVFAYEPEVHRLMSGYIGIRLLALGAIVGVEVLGNWYAGLGNTRLHMIAGVLAMVLNVALNWLLIHGNLGAPALGVEGSALASVIASWGAFALLLTVFLTDRSVRNRNAARGPGRSGRRGLRMAELLRMLRFGLPNGVNWFLEFAAFSVFVNVIVADLGTVALAAMMVVIQINSVSFMPAFGLSSASAILSGQAIGRGHHDEVAAIARRTLLVAGAWQGAVGLLYLSMPTTLMSAFGTTSDQAATFIEMGAAMLAVSTAWQLFDAVAMTLGETLRAAGDTAWCMWVRLILGWFLFLPLAVIATRVLDGGPVAAIACVVVWFIALAGALTWRFLSGAWRHIDLTGTGDGELGNLDDLIGPAAP